MPSIPRLTKVASIAIGMTLPGLCLGMPALTDFGINIDATAALITQGEPVPAGVDDSGLDFSSGLGSVSVAFDGVGGHLIVALFDHDIDDFFDDEYGASTGVLPPGWSWQIDDPFFGDIVSNWDGSTPGASLLNDTNWVPAGSPSDVSLALGVGVTLAADESALVEFLVADAVPSGFYLSQSDAVTGETLYLSAEVTVTKDTPGILPLPPSIMLLVPGLVIIQARRWRQR